jgi:hypothetical protein
MALEIATHSLASSNFSSFHLQTKRFRCEIEQPHEKKKAADRCMSVLCSGQSQQKSPGQGTNTQNDSSLAENHHKKAENRPALPIGPVRLHQTGSKPDTIS